MKFLTSLVLLFLSCAASATPAADETVLSKGDIWRSYGWFQAAETEDGKLYTVDEYTKSSVIGSVGLKGAPPPAGWMKPEFNDDAWLPLRGGLQTGPAHIIRQACMRGCFEVADPGTVTGLRAELVVRGGGILYLNGEEIGRVGMSGGEGWADLYPPEAYFIGPEKKLIGDYIYGAPYPPEGVGMSYYKFFGTPWLLNKSMHPSHLKFFQPTLTQPEWEAVGKLRDRRVEVQIPSSRLRKGKNVIAFSVTAAKIRQSTWPGALIIWTHATFQDFKLMSSSPKGPSAKKGAQVWSADVHQRIFNYDSAPYGSSEARFDLTGARNGVFSGQIVVKGEGALKNLSAAAGDLTGPGGAKIPATSLQIRYPAPQAALQLTGSRDLIRNMYSLQLLEGYATDLGSGSTEDRLKKLQYFDRLAEKAPEEVPAGTCQPVWLTVRVPKEAAPGEYKGTVTLKTGGLPDQAVPIRVEVIGWTVPDPKDFVSFTGVYQSPWGILQAMKGVEPWSDAHFNLMERSFKLMAELSADTVLVPINAPGEYGNRLDGLVPWIEKGDGTYDFSFTRLDRYLDLARKILGKPQVIDFAVVPFAPNFVPHWKIGVAVIGKDGKQKHVPLPDPLSEEGRKLWFAFAKAVYAHMKEKDLADVMYWGHPWDSPIDQWQKVFEEATPDVYWVRSTHMVPPGKMRVKYCEGVFTLPHIPFDNTDKHFSLKGWKNPELHVSFPRIGSVVATVSESSFPYGYRILPERAIVHQGRGFGRFGFDFWDAYQAGLPSPSSSVSMQVTSLAGPGPEGAEGTVRLEMLREGIQEAEARIAIEKAMDGGKGDAKAWEMLDARIQETTYIPPVRAEMQDYYGGWRERARALYEVAARLVK